MNYIKNSKIGFFSFLVILCLLLQGIQLEFIVRQGANVPSPLLFFNSKYISLFFIFSLPLVFVKLFKIIKSSNFIFFFIIWVVFGTLVSYLISAILGYSPKFSNESRTITQLGGLFIGFIFGYYIFRLLTLKPKLVVRTIHASIFLILIGIIFEFFFIKLKSGYDFRIFGLSGEPKHLGIHLVPYIIAVISVIKIKNFLELFLLCISCIILSYTLSVTAYIALLSMIAIYLKINGFLGYRSFALITLSFVVVLSIFLNSNLNFWILERAIGYISTTSYTPGVHEKFNFPIIGEIVVEGNEFPVLQLFKDNPLLMLTGVGIGQESIYSFGYIDKFGGSGFLKPGYKGYITPNFGLIASIANFGIILVISLVIWSINLAQKINKFLNSSEKFIFIFFLINLLTEILIFRSSIPLGTSIVILLMFKNSFNKKIMQRKILP
jgi:hypothetical protein